MPISLNDIDFSSLSSAERILLAETLWDSVYQEAHSDLFPVSDAVKKELERRLKAEEAGEMTFHSWDEVKNSLLKK